MSRADIEAQREIDTERLTTIVKVLDTQRFALLAALGDLAVSIPPSETFCIMALRRIERYMIATAKVQYRQTAQ